MVKWRYGSKRSRVFAPLRQMPGAPVAPRANRLPLLPSGPDGVHGALPHRTQRLTKRCKHARRRGRDLNPRGLSPYELSRPAHSARLCDLSELKGAACPANWRQPFSKSRISIAKRPGSGKSQGIEDAEQNARRKNATAPTQYALPPTTLPRQSTNVPTASRPASAPRPWQNRTGSCPHRLS